MKFSKLRLTGFKSFCEATDFIIEPGLTGVVGPNGCGKSNLVEAMRWVMGESSYKSMRASGMDDVIFSGSGNRPSRNIAEVGLVLDNSDRTAPAAFNDSETIEITRRIERDSGSTYRFNGREVRARDVQLLFADASTGARSPAMVRQGQIGEIIAAKPQQRRRILEEAAGIGGLYSRRHEAELRLKSAEDNIVRLEDVLRQIETQAEGLKRQTRQAARYRILAADIRRHEALVLYLGHRAIEAELSIAEQRLATETLNVAERTRRQAEAARLQAIAAYGLPALRDEEAKVGAALQRLVLAREALDGEEKRAKERAIELAQRMAQLGKDLARENALVTDAAGVLERIAKEDKAIELEQKAAEGSDVAAATRLNTILATLTLSEKTLGEAQGALADVNARRQALEAALRTEVSQLQRFETELQKVNAELAQLNLGTAGEDEIAALFQIVEASRAVSGEAEARTLAAEAAHLKAREDEGRTRGPLAEAERKAQRLETEVRTLAKMLGTAGGGLWPPVVDAITVTRGYEAALGAALGDDLDASTNTSAPAHWGAALDGDADPALPEGVKSLLGLVKAPAVLHRRLAQIGVVLRSEGAALRRLLKPGQRLVSKEGDLWRWDGFAAAAEAPTPAARRLVEKNRLGELEIEAKAARAEADAVKITADRAQTGVRSAATLEGEARQSARLAARSVEEARERAALAERKRATIAARLSALEEACSRLTVSRDEAEVKKSVATQALRSLVATVELTSILDVARAKAAQDRAEAAEARAAAQTLAREATTRATRRATIAIESKSWTQRQAQASEQIGAIEDRLAVIQAENLAFDAAPGEFLLKRRALMGEVDRAEELRKATADRRVQAETGLVEADKLARQTLDAMAQVREERARSEAQVEAQRARLAAMVEAIANDLECEPPDLRSLAGLNLDDPLPESAKISKSLDNLKLEREKLGPVNLRAEDELQEVSKSRENLVSERDDLTEAIRKLRGAIGGLNREGRERLIAAFEVVNGHFKELFTTLFGGGAAELQLVESDDPLEAGLEILARPPGKKPSTMTLLSGGEQALTAMSLIFAVFLTNPSPICVLDEVDAPLDDSNVERFCDLLDEMRKKTDTRFVTITHNPITMARMDRLFGVTMAERGVSQLVSVDLQAAERFLEAS